MAVDHRRRGCGCHRRLDLGRHGAEAGVDGRGHLGGGHRARPDAAAASSAAQADREAEESRASESARQSSEAAARSSAAAEAQRKADEEAERKANRITYGVTTTGSGISTVTCRIVRGNGSVVAENSSSGPYAVVSCG
ncbi:hypothetical protein [Amycolatopsis sp. cmx-4-61]|uniref:hypothetical protein n=1 Tax=Amycolatopsis sp. cmx-4-61 TaxID=2790937 RepID=UPI00397DF035